MKKIILATIASLFATTTVAQTSCEPTEANRALHAERGHELKVTGLLSNGTILEIWEAGDGTFGVLMSGPDGMTCFIISGQYLEINYPRPMKRPNL